MFQSTHLSPHQLKLRSTKILTDVQRGLFLAWEGINVAHKHPVVWSTQKKAIVSLAGVCTVLYLGLLVILLPLHFFLYLSSYILPTTSLYESTSVWNIWYRIIWFVPYVAMFVWNNVLGYDTVFFAIVRDYAPTLARNLRLRPLESLSITTTRFITRALKTISFALVIHFLHHLPIIGPFVPALWLIQFSYKLFRMTKDIYIKIGLTLLILAVAFISPLQPLAFYFLQIELASTALARELLDSYFSRLHVAIKPTEEDYQAGYTEEIDTSLPHKTVNDFLNKHHFESLGFSFPFLFISSIPMASVCCIAYLHASAAYFLVQAIKEEETETYTLRSQEGEEMRDGERMVVGLKDL